MPKSQHLEDSEIEVSMLNTRHEWWLKGYTSGMKIATACDALPGSQERLDWLEGFLAGIVVISSDSGAVNSNSDTSQETLAAVNSPSLAAPSPGLDSDGTPLADSRDKSPDPAILLPDGPLLPSDSPTAELGDIAQTDFSLWLDAHLASSGSVDSLASVADAATYDHLYENSVGDVKSTSGDKGSSGQELHRNRGEDPGTVRSAGGLARHPTIETLHRMPPAIPNELFTAASQTDFTASKPNKRKRQLEDMTFMPLPQKRTKGCDLAFDGIMSDRLEQGVASDHVRSRDMTRDQAQRGSLAAEAPGSIHPEVARESFDQFVITRAEQTALKQKQKMARQKKVDSATLISRAQLLLKPQDARNAKMWAEVKASTEPPRTCIVRFEDTNVKYLYMLFRELVERSEGKAKGGESWAAWKKRCQLAQAYELAAQGSQGAPAWFYADWPLQKLRGLVTFADLEAGHSAT